MLHSVRTKYQEQYTENVGQQMAKEYRDRIKAKIPAEHFFEPLMTIYLTSKTTPADIHEVAYISLYPDTTVNERKG